MTPAQNAILAENNRFLSGWHNKTQGTPDRYAEEHARELWKIFKKHAKTVKVTKTLKNGLKQYTYYDKNGEIVAELYDTEPVDGFTA